MKRGKNNKRIENEYTHTKTHTKHNILRKIAQNGLYRF